MATFIARVELQGSPSADTYTKLHDVMLAARFFQGMRPSDETWFYDLPHATYATESWELESSSTLYQKLRGKILTLGLKFKLVVIKTEQVTFTAGTGWEPN